MHRLQLTVMWIIAAVALGAIAVWPAYVRNNTDAVRAAALPTAAPVAADYLTRDRVIAFWEKASAEHHRGDMMTPGKLSAEYLQRFRERGDIGDVTRALHQAQLSLAAQPYGNAAAENDLGSALLSLHRFKDALAVTRHTERFDPGDPVLSVREASVDLELGRYAAAKKLIDYLDGHRSKDDDASGLDTLMTRYDELTGHLARARERFTKTTADANAQYSSGAQARAWYWFRSGELAFEAGDNDTAIADERQSLTVFPNYSEANRMLARFTCAMHRWQECLTAAQASAAVVPYPEVLGNEADAQRALGQTTQAAQTDDLIHTVERIGNTEHISDRLLAIYYSEHHENLDDAYRIAKRELAVRDDIFTDDTLAWSAAMDGHWNEARTRIARATQYGTENALLDYHAGMIALHFGDKVEAKRRLAQAIALNPHFHPFYADDARARLAVL